MIEQIPNVWWVLVLLGLAGGIVAGSLGVGGGIIFVPVLVIVFLLPQKAAQGTALAVMVPMALLGAIRYWRNPAIDVNPALVALLAVGALIGVLIGTEIASQLPGHWLRKAFALLILIAAARMFFMPPRPAETAAGASGQSQADVTTTRSEDGD